MTNPIRMTSAGMLIVLIGALAACNQGAPSNANAPTVAPVQPTNASQPTVAATKPASNQTPAPKACALLTVADIEKLSGYKGGDATVGPGIEAGDSTCEILSAQGKIKVSVSVNHIPVIIPPTAKTLDLEGGAQAVMGDAGWASNIRFSNYAVVVLLMGGTAVANDPAKKIAQVTKADGSIATYAQFYEALARAVAHNAASGAPMPSSVIDLNTQGDPCKLLTLDDVKQSLAGFNVTGPESRDSAYGGKQCVYRFTNDALKAAGFVGLEFLTQAKFDSNQKSGQPLSGIGDVAAFSPSGGLQVKKGNTLIYLTLNMDTNDPKSMEKIGQLKNDAVKQLAQKAAARIK